MPLVVELTGPNSTPRMRSVPRSAVVVENGEPKWRHGMEPGLTTRIPEEALQKMYATLPPIVRTTDRAKFEKILQQLISDARTMFLRDGVVHWPASVKRQLVEMGWKEGKPNMWAEIELLARKYVVETANRLKEADQKRVVSDWHRHYSA